MEMPEMPKMLKKFHCECCHYSCCKKSNFEIHLSTDRHFWKKNGNAGNAKPDVLTKLSCGCGKNYTSVSGLWKHRKKCVYEKNNVDTDTTNINPTDSNLIIQLLKQNDEFKHMLLEQNTKILETFQDACKINSSSITNNNVNSHNKTFNMNVFLNEHCKDAMNISEFVDSIKLGYADLVSVGKLGYVEGISGIIIKKLQELDIHKRPMHCGDEKRHSMYIKEDGKWEKDESDNKKLKKLIRQVAFKNTKNTFLFKEKYPDCVTSASRYSDQYNKIVIESFGGKGDNDAEKENKMVRMIAKAVYVDKNL